MRMEPTSESATGARIIPGTVRGVRMWPTLVILRESPVEIGGTLLGGFEGYGIGLFA